MRLNWLFLFVFLFVVACSPAAEPEPTPDIDAIVAATVAAQRQAFFEPILLSPADGTVFETASVILTWDWVRELHENEQFDLRVWKAGEPDYGITWTKANEFDLSQWLSQRDAGEYLWSVAAIEGADGTLERVIAEAPAPRRFTVNSVELPPPPTATPEPEPTVNTIVRMQNPDFKVNIFAHLREAPTAITDIMFDDEGHLLALTIDGRIYRIGDDDGDGSADNIQQILFNDDSNEFDFEWLVGLARYEDRYYVSDKGRIGYLIDSDDDAILDQYTMIVDGLPALMYPLHSNNGIAFAPDSKLYVSIGSTTDHGPLEVEYESSILRMNPDGSELEVFATGFRNPYDIEITADGRIFAGDNGPDQLDAVMPYYPPEELNYVREGRDYGFPDIYGNGATIRPVDRLVEPPITELTTSSVTSGIAHYSGHDAFPSIFDETIFVAQFGGFNQAGFKIVFVKLQETSDGGYTGLPQTFATFLNGHRPVDVTVGPDGALYATEWTQGIIFRITYEGDEK